MGIFDFLTGNTPAAAPPVAPVAQPNAIPAYADFYKNLLAAAAANAKAHPSSLWSALSGSGTDAATKEAMAAAPSAWQQFQAAQSGVQNAQLGTAGNLAMQGAMANTQIDPNNIMASVPAMQAGMSGAAQPAAGGADPLTQSRAFYDRLGNMFARNPATLAMAKDFFALRDKGIPDGTTVMHDGSLVDAASGNPIRSSVGDVKAAQAEPTTKMQTGYDIAKANHQAGLDIGVHTANANTDAARDLVDGLDAKTGLPVTRTRADVVSNGGMVKSNPYFQGQEAELKDLRTKAQSADQGLGLAQQISNAANGIFTGKGANTLQDVRKFALAAGNLTGAKASDSILNDASKFEQLKFASQQLVAVASHELSPRVAMNIYNQISAVKPGDATSIKGLRDIINNQIVPALARSRAMYKGVSTYYQQNPFKNDAAAVVPGQLPLEHFGVKDINSATPGSFFVDPRDGRLRQRPE